MDPSQQSERRRTQVEVLNSYRIDVKDSGPGIAPAHLGSIFEDYVSYGGKGIGGSGLGLAVCRMVMQRHMGKIWVENSSQGAVFSCVFPRLIDENASSQRPVQLSQLGSRE